MAMTPYMNNLVLEAPIVTATALEDDGKAVPMFVSAWVKGREISLADNSTALLQRYVHLPVNVLWSFCDLEVLPHQRFYI
jgi:hypothetical protein